MPNYIRTVLDESYAEELIELLDGEIKPGDKVEIHGVSYEYVDVEYDVIKHRWNSTMFYVFRDEAGQLWGLPYDIGNTESQESGWVYSQPKLQRMQAVTTIRYEPV